MAQIEHFQPTDIKAVRFPNAATFEVGGEDPHDEGTIISIEQFADGFEITGICGEEGYSYTIDQNGIPVDEALSDWDAED
jgi:hypothetical protein